MKVGDLLIDESEIVESFVRASGPGGQNVNKVASAVELRFDARKSRSLPDDVAVRLIKLAGARATQDGVIVIFAQRFSTQPRNRRGCPPPSRGPGCEGAGAGEAAPRHPSHARLEDAPTRREGPARRGEGVQEPDYRGRVNFLVDAHGGGGAPASSRSAFVLFRGSKGPVLGTPRRRLGFSFFRADRGLKFFLALQRRELDQIVRAKQFDGPHRQPRKLA